MRPQWSPIKRLTWRHVATVGAFIFINMRAARSRSDGHSEARSSSLHGDARSARFPSDCLEDSWKKSTIAVRSSRDRGSFSAESRPRSFQLVAHDRTAVVWELRSRSTRDSGPITARSWLRLKQKEGQFTANSGATTSSIETAPKMPSNHAHDRIKWP